MVVGLWCPGVRRSEINMGAVGALAAFKSDGHCLYAVLLVTVAHHHRLFAEHHVTDALSVVADALVTIEPFYFLKMCVLLIEIVAPDTEADSDKDYDSGNGKPQGIRFSDGEFTFNGSKIDRAFSYKRLDKFFAKNAGIREAPPPQTAPIYITAKVKESPVANVVENIIETGCQALGGLFQVGPGYDPDEEAFIRRMKRKPRKRQGPKL